MGVSSKLRNIRPPLPAPTESMDEGGASGFDTDAATTVTSLTEKTSYDIPEDGKPITISTQKVKGAKETGTNGHKRDQSQTSLLIEYFEGAKGADKTKSRPSVRVKVTPSSRKKSEGGGPDAVRVTSYGKDRKTSYTRRISLGSSKNAEIGLAPPEGTEVSQSSDSNISARPPVEIEVLDHNGSDLSTRSRGLLYAMNESNVSSMPPDSLLEGGSVTSTERSRGLDQEEYLQAPVNERDRSASRDRLAQKVMAKLGQPSKAQTYTKSKSERSLGEAYDRQRSSKSRGYNDDTISGADSSVLSSNVKSYRSGSDISNNPKLLGMVEDTIKRIILPEINAIKEDQKTDRQLRSYESSRRGSILDDVYGRGGLERRVSKSSSTPNISSKPKVVLNRDGEDPGTVLSRGDSERKKMRKSSGNSYTEERPSSRRSSGKHSSRRGSYDESQTVRAKSSKSSSVLGDAATASIASGLLTAAALRHHDSQDDVGHRRKRRSKSRSSRSRSAGISETGEDYYARPEDIPPMPMASHINESEMTRESLVSDITATPHSAGSAGMHTPVQEVSRGSLKDALSPASSRTPSRTNLSRDLGMSHTNRSIDSPKSPYGGVSTKARMAALAAAAVGGNAAASGDPIYDRRVNTDGYGGSPMSSRKISSPVQSISSLKKPFEEDTSASRELRPGSAASRSSAGRSQDKYASRTSLQSGTSSPSTKLARSRQQSRGAGGDEFVTPMERPGSGILRESTPGTPTYGESVDDWYERQHQLNDQYRSSLDLESTNHDSFPATNRDSYQTNPYPQDERRFTFFSEDGQDSPAIDSFENEQDVRGLGANPEYIHTPHGAESAVASLIIEPSNASSNKHSAQGSPAKTSFQARLRELGQDSPPLYQGSTLSQTMPSQDRWAALKGHARNISSTNSRDDVRGVESPRQSPAKSLREERSIDGKPVMSASGLPLVHDPLPEIGHFDDSKSDLTTNPSIIHGPLGGDATGKDTWPYTPDPQTQTQRDLSNKDSQSLKSEHGKEAGLVAAAAAGATALAAAHAKRQASVEDEDDIDRRLTPDVGRRGEYIDREQTPTSPAAFRDEGYITDASHARSAGALTPRAEQQSYTKHDIDEFNRAMEAYDAEDDPFTGNAQHVRNASGNSHGLASPLYDSATGKGIENIQSKDVVALMDHLTVRDAQRNARDTEILVTLVRTAAEMRQSFDDIKRFICEQDDKIMRNADVGADRTAQKVLGGPRPQPFDSPRTPRRQSEEDVQTKRKGVLRRALKGLTGSKSANDLAKVEDMLIQILDNVEDLKHQGVTRESARSYTNDSLDTYERLRNAPDSGYEPEGLAGTSSTPSHSGHLSLTPRGEKQQFHSGYDGRRGSYNRVSTVIEGDEEELEPHETHVLDHQFENNERLLTPTQEVQRQRGLSPSNTPPHHAATFGGEAQDITPRSTEQQRKHKSNTSSNFGIPKISRWSKTTASSGAPDLTTFDSPNGVQNRRAISEASRSSSALEGYDDDQYSQQDDDRLRSTQSLAREQAAAETRSVRSQASKITRTPSPLIPSEASIRHEDDYADERESSPIQEDIDDPAFDDPKYQAHRNSLLLQHPQPRQGTTGRHQNTLETQAYQYDPRSASTSDVSQRTVSDFDPAMWGSSGTAGLAKHRLSQLEPLSPVSMSSPMAYGGGKLARDEAPLIPQQKPAVPPKVKYDEPEPEQDEYWEPQYSNSGFSRHNYYNSPFGSGHLLEPIEEDNESLTQRQLSPEPQVASAKAVDMRSPARKITGPRPMGSRAPSQEQPKLVETSGTVRRKPVRG